MSLLHVLARHTRNLTTSRASLVTRARRPLVGQSRASSTLLDPDGTIFGPEAVGRPFTDAALAILNDFSQTYGIEKAEKELNVQINGPWHTPDAGDTPNINGPQSDVLSFTLHTPRGEIVAWRRKSDGNHVTEINLPRDRALWPPAGEYEISMAILIKEPDEQKTSESEGQMPKYWIYI